MKKCLGFLILLLVFVLLPHLSVAAVLTPTGDDNYISEDTVINVSASPYNIDDPNSNGVLIINASHVTLDCNNSVFNGTINYWRRGLNISIFENVTIKNCIFQNYYYGMWIYPDADNTTLYNNTAISNEIGIYVSDSDKLNISENNISFNQGNGLSMDSSNSNVTNNILDSNSFGIHLSYSSNIKLTGNNITNSSSRNLFVDGGFSHSIDKSNHVNGFPVYYFYNQDNIYLDGNNATRHITVSSANNVTVKNLNLSYSDMINFDYVTNGSIDNVTFKNNEEGIRVYDGGYNNITGNRMASINSRGIYFYNTNNNRIIGNNVSCIGNGDMAAYIQGSEENLFVNNTFNSSQWGIFILSSSNNTFSNNTAENHDRGLYIMSSSSYNQISNLIIKDSREDAIFLQQQSGNYPNNNNLTNVSVTNTNLSYYDIKFNDEGINETYIIDTQLENYTFTGNGGTIYFKNPYGEIRFLEPINGSGTNLSSDIRIESNLTTVESSANSGLNRSANITLHNLPGDFTNPKILRDSINCPSGCYNFTSLNAGTVRFNVSQWTNYSIGEDAGNGTHKNISSCQVLNQTGMTYLLTGNVSSSGFCMEIYAHNVTLDCQGHNLTGTGNELGIYVLDSDNVTVRNCHIYGFRWAGIEYENSSFGLVEYCEASNQTVSHGIKIQEYSHNCTVRFCTANYNKMTGFIAIESTSTYNLFHNNTGTGNEDHGMEIEHSAHHNIFTNNTMIDNVVNAICLSPGVHNNTVTSNWLDVGNIGVAVMNGSDNLIENNYITGGSAEGISVGYNSSRNILNNNRINGSSSGLATLWANHSNITNNFFENILNDGIRISNSSDIIISGNSFSDGGVPQFSAMNCSAGITVYNNIFISDIMIYSNSYGIGWDNGTLGNRWTSYDEPSEGCEDADSNGICDSSYVLDGSNTDYYPIALTRGAVSEDGSPGGGSPGSVGGGTTTTTTTTTTTLPEKPEAWSSPGPESDNESSEESQKSQIPFSQIPFGWTENLSAEARTCLNISLVAAILIIAVLAWWKRDELFRHKPSGHKKKPKQKKRNKTKTNLKKPA